MPKKKQTNGPAGENVVDYRHKGVTRLNIPPAGLAARGQIVREKQVKYAYNPHLAPTLRFDATGKAYQIEAVIRKAGQEKLEPGELAILVETFRNHEPWLEWAGEHKRIAVKVIDPRGNEVLRVHRLGDSYD